MGKRLKSLALIATTALGFIYREEISKFCSDKILPLLPIPLKVEDHCSKGDRIYLVSEGNNWTFGAVSNITNDKVILATGTVKKSIVTAVRNVTKSEAILKNNLKVFEELTPGDFRLSLYKNVNTPEDIFFKVFDSTNMDFKLYADRIIRLVVVDNNVQKDLIYLITKDIVKEGKILIV